MNAITITRSLSEAELRNRFSELDERHEQLKCHPKSSDRDIAMMLVVTEKSELAQQIFNS